MIQYFCPACDGNEIEVNDRLIQEVDPVTNDILHSEMKRELHCLRCGWSGNALQTVPVEESA